VIVQPEQAPIPIDLHNVNVADIAFDRTDIDVPALSLTSTTTHHIEKLLNIRARHKAPKALITDLLSYIHETFADDPDIAGLPTTWQGCEQAIKQNKPTFIKVHFNQFYT
jgi:hypothetical protein